MIRDGRTLCTAGSESVGGVGVGRGSWFQLNSFIYIVVFHSNPSLFITASFVSVNLKLSGRAGKGFRVADYSEDMKLLGCGERGQQKRALALEAGAV